MKIRARSLAFVALLCLSAEALASTLVVNCTTVSGTTELSASVVCAQFNVAASILQSVQIAVSGGNSGSLGLTNNASTTQSGSGTTSSSFNVSALAGFTFSNPLFTASFTRTQTINPGQTFTFSGLSGSGSGSLGTNTTNLAPYTGAGNFTIPFSTLTNSSIQGGGGEFGSSGSTNASATAVVTYTYVAAP